MTQAPYTISDARYAKGKKVIHVASDGSGMKTRAAYLADALGGRWVGRSKGYVLSPAAAVKFEKLWAAGFEANMRLYHDTKPSFFHPERRFENLTAAQALKLAEAQP